MTTIQTPGGVLMSIGTVAAHNIAQALGLKEADVPKIEQAIKDEINAMSSHFTLAIADVQTQHEIAGKAAKGAYDAAISAYSYVSANVWRVAAVVAVVFALGVVTGLIV